MSVIFRESRWVRVGLIVVLLLGLGLRLHRIDAQSLWNDEGTSVAVARRDLRTITRSAANDIHPPFYYYLLHFWIGVFGKSVLAVRLLSALLGTLLLLVTFSIARDTARELVPNQLSDMTGLLAMLLAALSPLQIYYSQETRMYILAALLAALSMHLFLQLLIQWRRNLRSDNGSPARTLWLIVGYLTCTILLLYTHYFNSTILLAQNLIFVGWWTVSCPSSRGRARLTVGARWIALQSLAAAAFAPWLWWVRSQLGVWPAISEPVRLLPLLSNALTAFGLGPASNEGPAWAPAVFGALCLLGVTLALVLRGDPQSDRWHRVGVWTCLLHLIVPAAAIYVVSQQRPMYHPKFLLPVTTPFYILIALGLIAPLGIGTPHHRLRLIVSLTLSILVLASPLRSLRAYYTNAHYARDDYRAIAAYVEAVGTNGDVVLVNAPGQMDTFGYYYHGALPVYPLPRQRPLDQEATLQDLLEMTSSGGRVYAVLWATDESDPDRFIESWLDQHTYKAMDSWYGNLRFVVYAVPKTPQSGEMQNTLDLSMGESIRLRGYTLSPAEVRPGDILQLTLYWEALSPIQRRFKVFTHLLDGRGYLVGQRDGEPGGGAQLTTIWSVGQQITDNYGIPVLPGTPPGEYRLEIGMYGLDDGQRLPVSDNGREVGDHVLLQSLQVLPAHAPPPLQALQMTQPLETRFGDLLLLGYSASRLGYEHLPETRLHPGDVVHLTLFWKSLGASQPDVELALELVDKDGTAPLVRRVQPTEGQHPSSHWRQDEVVRDQHYLHLAADLPSGAYHLKLEVIDMTSGLALGSSTVVATLFVE